VPEALLARVVAWAAARQPRAGLIGCAPAGGLADSEAALAMGFDDFVAGPYSAREIAARLRALHRRVHWVGTRRPARLRFGGMMLDTDGHELWFEGRSVMLTGTELAVVRALMRARGGALTRAELLDHAWGDGHLEISERAVDNVVLRLRRKLGKAGMIQTVRGVGFRLSGE
jgi:DNA-binding response OmpR family regulator